MSDFHPTLAQETLASSIWGSASYLQDFMYQDQAFSKAIQTELKIRHDRFLKGIQLYKESMHTVSYKPPKPLFEVGNAKLIDYAGRYPIHTNATPVVFIPSLINNPYIFDLMEENSFFSYLTRHHIRPLLIDWGSWTLESATYTFDDYLTKILIPLLQQINEYFNQPVTLSGYCMGGLFALAATQFLKVPQLALLATPWDFHARSQHLIPLLKRFELWLHNHHDPLKPIPQILLQASFVNMDPLSVLHKYSRFADLPPESSKAKRFIALENWVNSHNDLPSSLVQECLNDWFIQNKTFQHGQIGKVKINFKKIPNKPLAILPKNDKIVPNESARALVSCIDNVCIHEPSLGHVGMIVSKRAQNSVWDPFINWIKKE